MYHRLIWNNINQGKSNNVQVFYHNQRALSSTKSKETAAKTAEIAGSSSRAKRGYENYIVTSNDSIHNFISSWRYEDVIILFQFLDLDDLEPLDEEAIKKKMEEINEMFDVSGMIYHQRPCRL